MSADFDTAPTPGSQAGPPPVQALFGPLLIGVCVNCILYGILILQTVIYYSSYKKDPKWIRYFVLYLVIVETINIGCNIATIYEPLVLRYGTPEALMFFPIMITATPTTNAAISTPVQMFTAWRIMVITRKKLPAFIICAFSITSFAFAIYTAAVITIVRLFSKKDATIKPATVWFIAGACADLLITGTLYFSLSRRKTGFKSTDQIINRIIRLTLQTGLLTLLLAITETVTFIASPRTTSNFAIDFPLSKLYTNALLSTLNARLSWRKLANTEARDVEDDNVLFGRPSDTSSGVISQSGMNNRISAIRSQRARPGETTTEISFVDAYELESRGGHTQNRSLPGVENPKPLGVQIHKESQVVHEDEFGNRYSPHPYSHTQ